MSELFNALQKLEEKNISEIPLPPPLASGAGKGRQKQKIPYLKSFLLLALITIMTAIGIFILATEKENIFPPQVEQISLDLQFDPLPAPQATVVLPLDTMDLSDIAKEDDSIVLTISGAEELSLLPVAEVEKAGEIKTKEQQTALAAPKFEETVIAIEEIIIFSETLKTFIDSSRDKELVENDIRQYPQIPAIEIINEQRWQLRQEFTRKRLLQSAERLRHEGELVKALELYKKAWHKKPGAALANNIAAILISLHSHKEAEYYLHQGLRFSPDDPDILFNLKLIKQGHNHEAQ